MAFPLYDNSEPRPLDAPATWDSLSQKEVEERAFNENAFERHDLDSQLFRADVCGEGLSEDALCRVDIEERLACIKLFSEYAEWRRTQMALT